MVEGEKTADASQNLLLDYNVLTWSGGAGSVGKTNWECLAGKDVIIWPDNDEGEIKAAETLQKIVTSLNAEKSLPGTADIVPLPKGLPEKWDLADKFPKGWAVDTVKEIIKDALPSKNKTLAHEQRITETVSAQQKTGISIEKAANEFIDLCVLYENMSWDHPDDTKTLRKIEAVAGKYMRNEEFRQRIASCGNEMVIERLQTEMEEQKHLLIQDNIDSHNKAATNIEKAASEFIDLCVLYENMGWDHPDDSKTLRQIEAVVSKYMNNEEFKNRIEASKNDVAINRLQSEMEEYKQNISQSMSRGI